MLKTGFARVSKVLFDPVPGELRRIKLAGWALAFEGHIDRLGVVRPDDGDQDQVLALELIGLESVPVFLIADLAHLDSWSRSSEIYHPRGAPVATAP